MVSRSKIVILLILWSTAMVRAQEIPQDELQVNLNSYFDSFDVEIFYPSISYTRRMTDSSSINLRYLVDVISAASMRSHFAVDGVTSATEKEDGGGDDRPDEVRHEFVAGITQAFAGGMLSVNGILSKEHDYRSVTLATSYSKELAQKNTTVQAGLVRSWDKIYPQIRYWREHKDVTTISLSLTQILSKRLLAQIIGSYNKSNGFQSDPYQVVQITQGDEVINLEPVHPDKRTRTALGARVNYKIERKSALQLGIRYYWDDWDVNSFTTSISFLQHLSDAATLGLGFRNYRQSRAFFFKETYQRPEPLMTVDSKLDRGSSNEYQLKLTLNGGHFDRIPFLRDERAQLNLSLNFYHRQTETPNWHRRTKDLYAYIMSLGVRYRL